MRCVARARWTCNGFTACDVHRASTRDADVRALLVNVGPEYGGTPGTVVAQLVRGDLGRVHAG